MTKIKPPLKTKDRIAAVSLALFNEKGSGSVTTNHIAEAMGISPGNLYYHYSNKEEIIRTIWFDLISKMDTLWVDLAREPYDDALAEFFIKLFKLFYEFRFFWIELTVLLAKDEELSKRYRNRVKWVLKHYDQIMDGWVEKEIVIKENFERDRKYLLENTWFIGQFWINFCHINKGYVSYEDLKEGLLRVNHMLSFYFIPESSERIRLKIEKDFGITENKD